MIYLTQFNEQTRIFSITITFEPHENLPMTNQSPRARALETIRNWIASGELKPGGVLPPERELATRLDVSLGSIQRALRVLEDEGTLDRHGTRTRTVAQKAPITPGLLDGAVLVMSDCTSMNADPDAYGWAGYVTSGILSALSAQKIHAMVLDPRGLDLSQLDRMLSSGAGGLIVPEVEIPGSHPEIWAAHARAVGVPVVLFGDELGCETFDRVVPDHEAGAYELTRWLLSTGRQAIRMLNNYEKPSRWALERRAGYERALREAGHEPLPPIFCPEGQFPGLSAEAIFQAQSQSVAGALLPILSQGQPLDAIMAITDGSVFAAIAGLKLLGKTPNRDVAVVGYDDYWDQSQERLFEPTPPLATVNKRNVEIGRELVKMLLDRRDGHLPSEPQRKMVAPVLKVRGETSL